MPVPLAAKKIILGMLRIMASQVGLGSTSLAAAEVDSMAALALSFHGARVAERRA